MFGADTNILVRLLVGDDVRQRKATMARLRKIELAGETVIVSTVVLAELAWVLASAYGYERGEITEALRGILTTPPFVTPQRQETLAAIALYENGVADFSDYLILSLAQSEGCKTLLTFDRRLLKTAGCEAP